MLYGGINDNFKINKILHHSACFVASLIRCTCRGRKRCGESSKESAMQKAYAYGDSAIESWARDNLSSLRLIEVETRSRAGLETYI